MYIYIYHIKSPYVWLVSSPMSLLLQRRTFMWRTGTAPGPAASFNSCSTSWTSSAATAARRPLCLKHRGCQRLEEELTYTV